MVYAGGYDGTLRALPLDAAGPRRRPPRSNVWFWLSFPLTLGPVAALATWLTRRSRARPRRASGEPVPRARPRAP